MERRKTTVYEFFAGGGMARLGLGAHWDCVFANEWCPKKAAAYRAYFGRGDELKQGDVADLTTQDLPGTPDLVWASFPCQDLSLAGMGAGLNGTRSGTFGPFWTLMQRLVDEGRAPKIIALENVVGAITSHGGKDFEVILNHLVDGGYRAGSLVIDAIRFVPQSRPRLFVVAVRKDAPVAAKLSLKWPNKTWHPNSIMRAYAALPSQIQRHWVWWDLPEPTEPIVKFSQLIEEQPTGVKWHTKEQTQNLLAMMSEVNKNKLREVSASGELTIGTIYKRTRPDENGRKLQRAEVRFDEISGCLRTPVGGSSRQTVLVVEGKTIRSRLLSPREAARLMGVPEDYPIPRNYNEAYHLFGDGLVVPVVDWLGRHLLCPLVPLKSADQVSDVA
ncbi:MAG TPA: DNA cytosine methyltransferase [Bryobacteraceae bacterium]|nr:DNA cytosine methyltransferase [Bryobacteraceae bacterium]